jgi:tRNA threonylcarbamoyladenosine biosynthesis protein TsaB
VNPKILALDTTSEFGSLALSYGDDLLEEVQVSAPEGFGQVLFGQIGELLGRHGWNISDIDCFASAAGPGSFTGVRVGLTAVKGFAEALGKPVVAVSNLQAMAWFGSRALRAPILDARRGDIFGGLFDGALREVQAEVVTKLLEWLAMLPSGDIEFLSPDPGQFQAAVQGRGAVSQTPRALARAIAGIAADRFVAGQTLSPDAADANYVRRADAELFWKE